MSKQVPTHYRTKSIQPIDVIEAYGLDFSRGNALKYLLRAGAKESEHKSDDLLKAIWYLVYEIGGVVLADEVNELLCAMHARCDA